MPFPGPGDRVPEGVRTPEFTLRPITADDAERDYAAVMETRHDLRLWEQTSWPADDFTVEANRDDLTGLEQRHAEHRAYTYTVLDPSGAEALGCAYLFATGARFLAAATVTPLGDARWEDVELVCYFWVRRTQAPGPG